MIDTANQPKSSRKFLIGIALVAATVSVAGCGSDKVTKTTTTEQSTTTAPAAPATSTTTTTTSTQQTRP